LDEQDDWLSSYYSRITEEYKISMERKDRTLDWSITIFFIAFIAYAELLTSENFIGRIYLLLILELFLFRFFIGSMIAYSYLKKWRYIIQQIDSYHFKNVIDLEKIKTIIDTYDHKHTTTEHARYFIKRQLIVGFGLLLSLPILLIIFELMKNPPGNEVIFPLIASVLFIGYEISNFHLDTQKINECETMVNDKKSDEADTRKQVQAILIGSIFGLITGALTNLWADVFSQVIFVTIPKENLGGLLIFYTIGLTALLVIFWYYIIKMER